MGEYKYSNAIEVNVQVFDAQLKFGFETPIGMQEETAIILSPQHLKVLTEMLVDAVAQYEKQFGIINIPQMSDNVKSTEEMQ